MMISAQSPAILILIDTAFIGGPGKGILQLSRYFEQQNIHYVIVNFSYSSPRSTQFIDAARSAGLRIESISQRHQLDFSGLKRLRELIEQYDINIIQTHGYKGHVFAWLLRRSLPIRWLGLTHGWTYEDLKVRFYNALERLLLKFPDHVATVSPQLFQEIKSIRHNRNCSLIRNAVESHEQDSTQAALLREQFNIAPTALVFLTAGRFSPEKGHLVLLQAWQQYVRKFPGNRLVIAGDGPEKEQLVGYCRQHELTQSVLFAGYQNDLAAFYDFADAFVLPSISEGLPNVLLEALAASTPFIGTTVGAIPEVIDKKSGILVAPGNAAALHDALEVFTNMTADERSRMAQSGQEKLEPDYSASGRGRRFMEIYENLLSASDG